MLHKAFVRNPRYVAQNLDKIRDVFAELSALLLAKEQAISKSGSISDTSSSSCANQEQEEGSEQGLHQEQKGTKLPQVQNTQNGHVTLTNTARGIYLVGDRFSAADLTFASLAAPVLFPPEYGASLCDLTDLDPGFQQIVAELRATVAGQHALKMYKLHRCKSRCDKSGGSTELPAAAPTSRL